MARRVRHLRLKADSREAVGRVLPGLEDALRTATLPDDGGRLLLVRRIALGRIAADAAPASLALALERAVAAARIDCRPAESATAAGAAAVWFRDALHAHVALALRLLEGPPPVEWFWPLAVPAWSPGCSGAAALRVLAASLAARPEGPAALPAWRAALRARGHGPALAGEPGTTATVAARRSPVVAPGPAARLAAAPVRTTEARPELADDPAAAAATVLVVATPVSPGPGRAEAAPARPAAPEPLPADPRSAPPAPGASAINEPHRRAAAAAMPAAPAGPAAWCSRPPDPIRSIRIVSCPLRVWPAPRLVTRHRKRYNHRMIDSPAPEASPAGNAPEWTVSDLSGAIKRTIEDAFGFVRVRGEISGYRGPVASGHMYFSLKDANAKIDAVIWKGVAGRLKLRPEEGLDVIATGKLTTFAGKSGYQLIIDSLELAGLGALMAMLEERRRKLAAEGLFDAARKQLVPYLPRVIGVITSPTGAVIRDILHRLDDRFPRHVLVWPVRVQGDSSAAEVAAAIRGFNALPEDGSIPRPDVLIVARGGGSLEDLMGFNDESVVRAAAESMIPLISAVGHETDWTLIDHAADWRAPTPTAAAEKAVPVRAELMAALDGFARRHGLALRRDLDRKRSEFRALARALPQPEGLLALHRQRLDLAATRLPAALQRGVSLQRTVCERLSRRLADQAPATRVARLATQLTALGGRLGTARATLIGREQARLATRRGQLAQLAQRLGRSVATLVPERRRDLVQRWKLVESLGPQGVLGRGYALVLAADGQVVRSAGAIQPGAPLTLRLADGERGVTADGSDGGPRKAGSGRSGRATGQQQGDLF